jgi:hypothetical protein
VSAPAPLVDLTDVKAHLNINPADTSNDAELSGFIDAATAYILNLTGPIDATQYTEVHSGNGPAIVLRNVPVVSVQSVTEYIGPTAYVLTQSELGAATGAYAFSLDNPQAGVLTRRYNGGIVGAFAGGVRNIVVTYTAGRGYVPADVRMAVLQDIAGLFQPSQEGSNPYYANAAAGNAPLNPIGMFPRVTEILSAPTRRTPSIA